MIVTADDVWVDQRQRTYAGRWRWDSRSPLLVELHLTPGRAGAVTVVWVLARPLLACPPEPSRWLRRPGVAGDVRLTQHMGLALLTLYPDTSRWKVLYGDVRVCREFLRETQRYVPCCPAPQRCAGCEECDAVLAGVDAFLEAA